MGFGTMLALMWFSIFPRPTRNWFVKACRDGDTTNTGSNNYGRDGNGGTSWDDAFRTIAKAVSMAMAGDTIYCIGTALDEAVTVSTTSGFGSTTVRSIRIIGAGADPEETQWTCSTADSTCLTINAIGVTVANIRFKPPTYTSGTPAAIKLGTSASYTMIDNCRFQGQTGSRYAIYSAATGADNVKIRGNKFMYMNNVTTVSGSAIVTVQATPWNAYSGWEIIGNEFNSCVVDIAIQARCCKVQGNTFAVVGNTAAGAIGTVTTTVINLSGHGAECGGNVVTDNTFAGAYTTTLYNAAAATDNWNGNKAPVTATTAPYGLTVAVPAS
jgi:hypothetical protein